MAQKGAKVLVIEDSPAQANVIADIVRQAGHVPTIVTQLKVGIAQLLQQEQPAVVLLDLRLLDEDGNPMADGFQLCREIKRSPLKPAVIVISAEGDDEACDWAKIQGADGFIQKPFAARDLMRVLTTVVGG